MVLILHKSKWRDGGRKQPQCRIQIGQRSNNCNQKFKRDSIKPAVIKHEQKERLIHCVFLQCRQQCSNKRLEQETWC